MNDRLDVLCAALAQGSRNFAAAEDELRALVAAHGDSALLVSDETLAALGVPSASAPRHDAESVAPTLHLSLLRG